MLRRRLLVSLLLCLPAAAWAGQNPPSEYATFTSHGKSITCPVYVSAGQPEDQTRATLILLRGVSPAEILRGREAAVFFAEHGFRVLMPDYLSVTPNTAATPAHYRRWAQMVDDIVAGLRAQPEQAQKIALAGQGLGASVALIAGTRRLAVEALAEWSGELPNQFFSEVESLPPLLILHGELDEEVPIVNARQLVRLCELKDFTCEIQIYAGQGHVFSSQIADKADQRVLAFFRSNLHLR